MGIRRSLPDHDSYQLLVDGMSDCAICLLETNGTITSWSAGAECITGYAAPEAIGANVTTFHTALDVAPGEPGRAFAIARTSGEFLGSGWCTRKDGSRFWASVAIKALRTPTGELIGFAGITRDITERAKRDEQQQVIADSAQNGILIIDESGVIASANARAGSIFGDSPDALVGRPLDDMLTPAASPRDAVTDRRSRLDRPWAKQRQGSFRGLFALRRDGRRVPVEATFNAASTERSRILVASIVDITDRLHADDQQRQSTQLLIEAVTDLRNAKRERDELVKCIARAAAATRASMWEWQLASGAMHWDQRMLGRYDRNGGTTGATRPAWTGAIHPDDRARVTQELAAAVGGAPLETEFHARGPSGELRIIRAQATLIRDAAGLPQQLVGSHVDVTEMRRLTDVVADHTEHRPSNDRSRGDARERRWPSTAQRALSPCVPPDLAGCEIDAFSDLGTAEPRRPGSWFDALRLTDGRVLVTLGDVREGAFDATIVAFGARQIMRGIAQLHADPGLMLDGARRALCLEFPSVSIGAWVGIIDPVARTLTFATAELSPPVVAGADGSLRALPGEAPPLNAQADRQHSTGTLPLRDGDTLIFGPARPADVDETLRAAATRHERFARRDAIMRWGQAQHLTLQPIASDSIEDVALLVTRLDCSAAETHIERWCFDARDPQSASATRRRFVRSLEVYRLSSSDLANAEIIFGELVGNVLRHCPGAEVAEVAVDRSGPRPVLHVLDRGGGFRHIRSLPSDPYAENGRGLFLIGALTADFSVTQRPGGGSHARAVLECTQSGAAPEPTVPECHLTG